ncbi:Wzz/FepE/Etk N-terminal domain-containing protein [Gemelliphila palaticanis]|uniref:Capsular biosynthesis protein CpsC n=1 Tax=Gemelliphila palaticanis TaxID=81950 RepID=A0ABX2T1K9_9BACL|nr:Wzz/FepE/Etk N-terminal domain-containing protein [Gemella palaticanis]MBF0715602.1 capsular biosynthesis protein CpsC [Gemella palaticanis]NYS47532.1 capsular biosynthesis protein CpsC [Gemella palaticanis]
MNNEKELQIDVIFLLKKLWSKKFIIVATSIFFAALAVSYSVFLVKPVYESTTKIYTVNNDDNKKSLTVQDLQIGSNLVKDYQEIILSKDVLNEVVEKEKLNTSAATLASKIKVSAPKDTRIIQITVSDHNPEIAKKVTDTLKEVASAKIKEITKLKEITTIEDASIAAFPSSPNIKKNGLLAFAIGFILSAGLVLLKELLDDKVKRPEDIEEVMELVLLGVIPDSKKGLK